MLDNTTVSNNPLTIFQPFQLACRSGNPELLTIAIDCLGKLFSYNYWKEAKGVDFEIGEQKRLNNKEPNEEEDQDNDGTEGMISFVIDTICEGFSGESTDEKVQLQIIKVTIFLRIGFSSGA